MRIRFKTGGYQSGKKFGNPGCRGISSMYNRCEILETGIATEVVEVPQKMETTSESIGLCK
jgi:hypothetical protein